MVGDGRQLDMLDDAALTPLVRRALNDETAELLDWQWSPIAYDMYLPGRTLVRFTGRAVIAGDTTPWSIVLKKTDRPQDRGRPSDDGWKREALAYWSGLLTDISGPLTAARALAVTEGADGATWLWLEDVVDHFGGAWPLDQYSRAGRHFGQFNGAYLVGCHLPTAPWLLHRWAELNSQPTKIPEALSHIEALASDGRVRRAFPVPIANLAPQLLRDEATLTAVPAQLSQTLCHHDASQANLFARQRTDGLMETVAIDWEYLGPGAVGAEIATLVFGTMRRGIVPAERATALDQYVFAGYLQGLRDAGWRGNPDLVRLGYTTAVALRWSLLYTTLRALTDAEARSRIAHMLKEPEGRAVRQFVLLSMFLLECADEARRLARQLALTP